jgi:long-chain acyl-CoA synthetase
MQSSAYVLRHGKTLCVFPEGSRSITGKLLPIRKGVVILAKELDVPIMPAYIKGAHEAWPPTEALPRPHPITIIFGREESYAELAAAGRHLKPDAPDDEVAALGLRQAIENLRGK